MLLLKNCHVVNEADGYQLVDILIEDGLIKQIGADIQADCPREDMEGRLVTPGFIDLHVHLREPGFTTKETIRTGTRAAAAGGFTTVFAMPNTNPVPDTPERMKDQIELARKDALVRTQFYSSITRGEKGLELVDFKGMAEAGSPWYTDDGRGVQDIGMMYEAMKGVAAVDGIIAAHCEEESLLEKGYIHQGPYARTHAHWGIARAVEDVQTARDLIMAGDLDCRYHLCHMSTFRTVELLRLAKAWGQRASGEVTPHHLLLTEADLKEDGNFKMNPPLREELDRQALIKGLNDHTITCIATDHAPHTESEKSKGLEGSAFGITGLETAFPLLYTHLVKTGLITLATLVNAMTRGPAEVMGLKAGQLKAGYPADITVIDLHRGFIVDKQQHYSLGKNTPFQGWRSDCRIHSVYLGGNKIVSDGKVFGEQPGDQLGEG